MANVVTHKKVSAKADGADNSLIHPSDWNAEHLFSGGLDGQFVQFLTSQTDHATWAWVVDLYQVMTNNSGGTRAAGDVVVADNTVDNSYKTIAAQGSLLPVYIVQETTNNAATGRVKAGGRAAVVAVTGAVTRGDFLRTNAGAGLAESAGTTAVDGVFGTALTGSAGPGAGTIVAQLFGVTLQIKPITLFGVRGLVGDYNTSVIFNVSADFVMMRDSNDKSIIKKNTGVVQLNVSTLGPGGKTKNLNNGFNYVYGVSKADGTYNVCVDPTPPPTGPDLTDPTFSGYTFWAFLGILKISAAPAITQCRWRGAWLHYEGTPFIVLTAGNAIVETAVSTATAVPNEAEEVKLEISALATAVSQANALRIRVTTGVDLLNYKTQTTACGTLLDHVEIPNVGQNFYYLRQTALVTDIWVEGFSMRNGGD